jgi:hypothetical protein
LHLLDSSSGKVEAVYRPVFEDQQQKTADPEVQMDVAESVSSAPAPATSTAEEVVPSPPKAAPSKEVAAPPAQTPVPASKEKKDIDMFADDDSD